MQATKKLRRSANLDAGAFTLVELLVVVSIIALLIAILLPSLQSAREQAKSVVCKTRLRGLVAGAITYSSEYGRYPPSHANLRQLPSSERGAGKDWLGVGGHLNSAYQPAPAGNIYGGVPAGFDSAPTLGLLWPYCKDENLFLCSKHKTIPIGSYNAYHQTLKAKVINPGSENDKFSYTMFATMGLRRPEEGMPPALTAPTSGGPRGGGGGNREFYAKAPASDIPFFVEEHPEGIGRFINGHVEGTFNTGVDRVVARHGPFRKRDGVKPGQSTPSSFLQGVTNMAFADGHVDDVATSYAVTATMVQNKQAKGIPDTADGLLWYFHLQEQEIWVKRDGGLFYNPIQTP